MVCTFFGHRDTSDSVKSVLERIIKDVIEKYDIEMFYVGNNGNFDYMVQDVLEKISKEGCFVNYTIVISRLDESVRKEKQSHTMFPESVAKSLPRYAISKRNDWMISHSNMAIVGVINKFSNAYRIMQKLERKGLKVINVYDECI